MSAFDDIAPIKTVADLAAAGLGTGENLDAVAQKYAIAVTPAITALIDPTDPDDPIARQFVPDPRELITTPDERIEPIGDLPHPPVEGIVHRYPDRLLRQAVPVCPV